LLFRNVLPDMLREAMDDYGGFAAAPIYSNDLEEKPG
jgi:hypothetical protein